MGGDGLSIRLHGPNVTPAATAEAGEALRDLMQTVADDAGLPVKAVLGSISRVCDGCNTTCPSLDLPPDWKNVNGDDLCPDCLATNPGANDE